MFSANAIKQTNQRCECAKCAYAKKKKHIGRRAKQKKLSPSRAVNTMRAETQTHGFYSNIAQSEKKEKATPKETTLLCARSKKKKR